MIILSLILRVWGSEVILEISHGGEEQQAADLSLDEQITFCLFSLDATYSRVVFLFKNIYLIFLF